MALREHFFGRVPLTRKVLLLTFLIGVSVWLLLDSIQNRELEGIFLAALTEELEEHAMEDRAQFDHYIQAHNQAAKIITAQGHFLAYVRAVNWDEVPSGAPIEHFTPPKWMPENSVLRSFFHARFALLLDRQGQVREIYRHSVDPLPATLLQPEHLLRKLTHYQLYLTEVEGQPFALAAQTFPDGHRRVAGTLLLASPIDEEFLRASQLVAKPYTLLTLLGGTPSRVIASSNQRALPTGKAASELKNHFLVMGQSFFDGGASDLDVQFASLVSRDKIRKSIYSILMREKNQRIYWVAALVLPFLLMTYSIANRILRVNERVSTITRTTLGVDALHRKKGDELALLMAQVQHFATELEAARDALFAETREKILLTRKTLEAEQQVRQLQQLQAVTEALGVGVIMVEEGKARAANRLMEEFIEECGGINRFMAGEKELLELNCGGRTRWFRVSRPEVGDGRTQLVQDLTEQITAERERNLFLKLPAQSPNPVLRITYGGSVEYANAAGNALLHHLGSRDCHNVPEPLRHQICRAIDDGSNKIDELPVAEKFYSFVIASIDGAEFMYLHGTDVSARKQAEEALRQSEARFRSLLELAPDGVIIFNYSGNVEFVNDRIRRLFGYCTEELVGAPIGRLIPREALCYEAELEEAGEGLAPIMVQECHKTFVATTHEGGHFVAEIRLAPLLRSEGMVFIGTIRDVTEREQAAAEIQRLNDRLRQHVSQLTAVNRELEAFSYSVSHDLRAPLRSIDGFSKILLDDYGSRLDEEAKGYLGRLRSASQRMGTLIDELLQLSRITRARMEKKPVELSALAEEVAEGLVQSDPEHRGSFLIVSGMVACGDGALIRVVLENLMGNAWKFSSATEQPRIEVGVTEAYSEDRRVFYVRDNGAGFDMRYAHKLFSPFERLHLESEYPGSGIGLATVERIIHRHGGEVWAESEIGRGSTFYFTLDETDEAIEDSTGGGQSGSRDPDPASVEEEWN